MEGINILDHMVGIGVTLLTTGFFAMVGFVWKTSHKASMLEQRVEAHEKRIASNAHKLEKLSDKQYSIVRTMPRD